MISERSLYTYIRRQNRLNFSEKSALESYQQEKMQHFFRNSVLKNPFYAPILTHTDKAARMLPLLTDPFIEQNFNALVANHLPDYRLLFDEAKQIHETGEWPAHLHYYILTQPTGKKRWTLRPLNEEELLQKISHFLYVLGQHAGSLALSIAHVYRFTHIMRRLPAMENTDYQLYSLAHEYDTLVSLLEEQSPDILIAPQGMLLQLAYDKLDGQLALEPAQVFVEDGLLSMRDKRMLSKAFGNVLELQSQAADLIATPCSNGQLHLTENQFVFELHPIDKDRFIPIYTDFNTQTLPLLRFQSDSIFLRAPHSCACSSPYLPILRREMRTDDVFWLLGANGYVPVFATPLEDFAATCLPWNKEFRIVQESLNHIAFYSETDPVLFKRREGVLRQTLRNLGVKVEALEMTYHELKNFTLYRDYMIRINRAPFDLPSSCQLL